MKMLRWILFVPISACASVCLGVFVRILFPKTYFYSENLLAGFVGLAPLFMSRFIAIVAFILFAAAMAPRRGHGMIAFLGLLGGVAGWPISLSYGESAGGHMFYFTEGIAVIAGAAAGMLLAFAVFNRSKLKTLDLDGV